VELHREIMERFGDEDKPVWINEYGWNAPPASFPKELLTWERVTEEEQAEYTVRGIEWAQENWPWLGVVNIWYFRQVGDVSPDRAAYYFALIDPEFNPRPVYEAVRLAAQRLDETAQGDQGRGLTWPFLALWGLCGLVILVGSTVTWTNRNPTS
jgi:hypothetical protein